MTYLQSETGELLTKLLHCVVSQQFANVFQWIYNSTTQSSFDAVETENVNYRIEIHLVTISVLYCSHLKSYNPSSCILSFYILLFFTKSVLTLPVMQFSIRELVSAVNSPCALNLSRVTVSTFHPAVFSNPTAC